MLSKLHRREDGAVLPVTAVYLIVGIGVLALALDLGHIFFEPTQRDANSGGDARLRCDSRRHAGFPGLCPGPGRSPGRQYKT